MDKTIRLAIAGVGNCASSLIQGIEYCRLHSQEDIPGLTFPEIGGYKPSHIQVVAAFDIDQRKVNLPFHKAVFSKPNCTTVFQKEIPPSPVTVKMGPVLDGVAKHMHHYPENQTFKVAQEEPIDIAQELKNSGTQILVCYLPVGSEEAVKFYARTALQAQVAFINCVPVFIASNPEFAEEFKKSNLPLVGDDIKSQFGATMLHRTLVRALSERGLKIDRTYQLNTGGNTDFLNMLEQSRLKSKRISKTESVQSQLDVRLETDQIHIGPSDYVPWQKDNKICFLRIEWKGFGGVPMNLEARLSVEDSPNSAGVVLDAIRCTKLALDKKIGGVLHEVSAFTMKLPPKQMQDSEARHAMEQFIS